MTATLKEQIQKLESEGKKDEAQQKMQSFRAIDSLLQGNPRFTALSALRNNRDPKQSMEEIKKLHARLKELTEQSSKLPEGATGERDKIKPEIEKVMKEIAEKHQTLNVPFPFGGQPPQFAPGQPFPPGMGAAQFTQQPLGAPGFQGGGFGFATGGAPGFGPGQPQGFGGSEGTAMLRKSEALSQAAAQLKKNGLDEQAQPLLAQAEELRAKAHKMMQEEAETRRTQTAGGGGFGTGAGGFGAAVRVGGVRAEVSGAWPLSAAGPRWNCIIRSVNCTNRSSSFAKKSASSASCCNASSN